MGWAICGAAAVLLLAVRLTTELRADGVYVRLWPLHLSFRHVPWADIERHEAVEYNSLARYGGWGLRVRPGEVAYNVGGSHGVSIERAGKQTITIGSDSPGRLLSAIDDNRGR